MIVYENKNLAEFTTFKIGGAAKKVYFPENTEEFEELLKNNKNLLVLGNGSNVLISSDGIDREVVFTTKLSGFRVHNNEISAECGLKCAKASTVAAQNSLKGFEFMAGIPGTIGGVVYMNASAHNCSVADVLKECKIFDLYSNEIKILKNEDMHFEYRNSILSKGKYILLEAVFELEKGNETDINALITRNLEFRKQCQPTLALPNAGSVFKNPENDSAGRLLDKAGLKSAKVGGAKVWENHANFIVNTGGATSKDVIELMKTMRDRVSKEYMIELKPEIKFYGKENGEDKELWQTFLK